MCVRERERERERVRSFQTNNQDKLAKINIKINNHTDKQINEHKDGK